MEKLDIVKGKQESDDYPYGRLRCHITFDVEFNPPKGYRFVTQTTNPKTGRVNKPKKSTYSDYIALHRDENGHIKQVCFDLRGYDDIAQFIDFLTLHDIEFTDAESQYLWVNVISCIRANAQYTRLADGVEIAHFLETARYKRMIELCKEHTNFNEIKNIGYDLDAINALRAQ